MGRLGNQMFQFASTIGIGLERKIEVRFPIENCLLTQPTGPFDPLEGKNMEVKCELLEGFQISPEYFIPQRHLQIFSIYNENCFTYDSGTEHISENTSLYGYFQTEKYFSRYRDIILNQFRFKDDYRKKAELLFSDIRNYSGNKPVVSLHVRRGDYLMYQDHHPSCSFEYYSKATEKIKSLLGDCVFVIFSDDTLWCSDNFKGEDFKICSREDHFTEMCMMTLCDHNIIANSSFSWWGAWLNESMNKIVIAPEKWFGPAMNKDTSDVYCKNWIKF